MRETVDVYKRQPYIRGVTDRIGKLLSKRGVTTIFKPTKKIQQFLVKWKAVSYTHLDVYKRQV